MHVHDHFSMDEYEKLLLKMCSSTSMFVMSMHQFLSQLVLPKSLLNHLSRPWLVTLSLSLSHVLINFVVKKKQKKRGDMFLLVLLTLWHAFI